MKYGSVGAGTYFCVYITTLSSIYGLVASNIIASGDVISMIASLGLEAYLPPLSKTASDFTVAWLLTKITEPARFAVTLAITPSVARLLGRKIDERKEKIKVRF